jgi:hypothetical protein
MMWRALLTIVPLLMGLPVFLAAAQSAPPSETETRLLARMQRERDPVKKSKDATRLARFELEQAIQAYEHGNTDQGARLVTGFLGRIKDSWQILKSSGRNAARDSRGFKELDIEMREDVRLLEDLKRRISYFDRGPVEKAQKEIEQARTEVIQALFPVARTPEGAKPLGKTD